ncbi:hypothetical protein CW354_22015 [Marinicaulis flavus]|uniref:Uncharacterized protein n=1 Tax=Hyphococcus luteus TaxID=2058213 RepID=A0A2S7JZC9_9PROT|nr:hypothetical protein CW354_22015 [Marinicaulis flavus]
MLLLCVLIVLFASVEIFRDQLDATAFRFLSIFSVLVLFVFLGSVVLPVLRSKTERTKALKVGRTVILYGLMLSLLIGGVLALGFYSSGVFSR